MMRGDRPPFVPRLPEPIVAAAACRWRDARDAGEDPQPRLHALLAPLGYDMLAPVIDSVMTLGEACLGRPLCRDCPFGRVDDAKLLCALLADPGRLAAIRRCHRHRWSDALFAGALVSTRVMLAMA